MMKLQVFGSSHGGDKHVVQLMLVLMVMITMASQGIQGRSLRRGVPFATAERVGGPIRRSDERSVNPKVDGRTGTTGGEKEATKILQAHPTGSTLPECSHACGPCFPCKRVMVSFKCSVNESCPIVY
ncbi:unnamed protein product, partial [Linum tenue]